jgi:uncharacterized protein YhaN
LILDEPFAHFDDGRFLAAMRHLARVAASRQVILLTCHEARHRDLEARLGDLGATVHRVRREAL